MKHIQFVTEAVRQAPISLSLALYGWMSPTSGLKASADWMFDRICYKSIKVKELLSSAAATCGIV